MFKLNKGVLSMDNHDLDHIQGRIDDGDLGEIECTDLEEIDESEVEQ